MALHVRKWFIEHSSWDIAKEIVRYLFGPATVAALFVAARNLPSNILALIQLVPLTVLALAVIYQRKTAQPLLLPEQQPEAKSQSFPLTLLDFHHVRDNRETTHYKLKLRAVFRNDFPTTIVITQLRWHANSDEVQLQPVFAHRFQVERALGGWKNDDWVPDELFDIVVRPGWAFRFWVGVSPVFGDADIRQRHETRRIGTVTLLVKPGEQLPHELSIRL